MVAGVCLARALLPAAALLSCGLASAHSSERAVPGLRKAADARSLQEPVEGMTTKLQASLHDKCGVSGIVKQGGDYVKLNHTMTKPKCNTLMSTNCVVTYAPMECPDDCPFIAPNQAFACLFQCVDGSECSDVNPDRALPNKETKVCETCELVGCKECESQKKCKACHEGFILEADGSKCTFWLEKKNTWAKVIVLIVAVLVVVLLLTGMLWNCCREPHSFETLNQNAFAIRRARRHRLQVKCLKWNLEAYRAQDIVSRYPLSVDVHNLNICGMGLALFYNAVVFTITLTIILAVFVHFSYATSGVDVALAAFELDQEALWANKFHPDTGAPARIVSRLFICSDMTTHGVLMTISKFAQLHFLAMGALWVVLFCALVKYTLRQKQKAIDFDQKNVTMADYVLRVEGLPAEETDEPFLRDFFEAEFRKAVPGAFARPKKVKFTPGDDPDELINVPDSGIEVNGVSIAYDYCDRVQEVDTLIRNMVTRQEVHNAEEAHAAGFTNRLLSYEMISGGREGVDKERKEAISTIARWFDKSSDKRIKGSGQAFIVFKYTTDKGRVLAALEQNPGCLKFDGNVLEVFDVHSEPPAIMWWNMGVEPKELRRNVTRASIKIFIIILAVQALVIYPYAKLYLWPFSRIGSSAGGLSMTILGMVIGFINMQVGMQIWGTCYDCGFSRKESMDTMVLLCNTLVAIIGNLFNIGLVIIEATAEVDATLDDIISVKSYLAVGFESRLGKNMYNIFVPGYFFVGNLMTIVMAGIWPFTFATFLQKLIYIWRGLPDGMLRIIRPLLPWAPDELKAYPFGNAEKGLEPMEIQIGDYTNLVILPFLCSLTLLTMSPYTPKLMMMLVCWGFFYYVFLRYLHFRFCKKSYYTRSIIDNYFNILWGLPLSVVAVAFCLYGIRSGHYGKSWPLGLKIVALVMSFILSMGAWLLTYFYYVNPWEKKVVEDDPNASDVTTVQGYTCYSWFNCNPVFVLKSAYLYQDEFGKPAKRPAEPPRQGGCIGNPKQQTGTTYADMDHPLASGLDPSKIRYYQVGKEYLFLKPEKQDKAFVEPAVIDFEFYYYRLLEFLSTLTACGFAAPPEVANGTPSKEDSEKMALLRVS